MNSARYIDNVARHPDVVEHRMATIIVSELVLKMLKYHILVHNINSTAFSNDA